MSWSKGLRNERLCCDFQGVFRKEHWRQSYNFTGHLISALWCVSFRHGYLRYWNFSMLNLKSYWFYWYQILYVIFNFWYKDNTEFVNMCMSTSEYTRQKRGSKTKTDVIWLLINQILVRNCPNKAHGRIRNGTENYHWVRETSLINLIDFMAQNVRQSQKWKIRPSISTAFWDYLSIVRHYHMTQHHSPHNLTFQKKKTGWKLKTLGKSYGKISVPL